MISPGLTKITKLAYVQSNLVNLKLIKLFSFITRCQAKPVLSIVVLSLCCDTTTFDCMYIIDCSHKSY